MQANDVRDELERERTAYREIEIQHASELRDLMQHNIGKGVSAPPHTHTHTSLAFTFLWF